MHVCKSIISFVKRHFSIKYVGLCAQPKLPHDITTGMEVGHVTNTLGSGLNIKYWIYTVV